MVEGDQLADVEQLGFGEERVGPEALRELLAPGSGPPAQVADEAAAEGRQPGLLLGRDRVQRGPEREQRILRERRKAFQRT